MARKPDLKCNRCGSITGWSTSDSLPEGRYRCEPCRRIERERKRAERRPAPKRPRPVANCELCSIQFTPKRKTAGRFCSRACAFTVQRANKKPPTKPFPKRVSCPVEFLTCRRCDNPYTVTPAHGSRMKCPACKSAVHAERVAARVARANETPVLKPCGACGKTMTLRPYMAYRNWCSRKCRKDAKGYGSDKQRAAWFGVEYEPINRSRVYERDGWMCGICGDAVDPLAKWPDQMCASLDHVVAMNSGGGHVYANVQCAHWWCNSVKSDKDLDLRAA